MQIVQLPELHCYRCVYTWTPIRSPVRMCPRCKSRLWDIPKITPLRLGNSSGIEEVLRPHRETILRLARKLGARQVRVFGSVRRREADAKSDVDLLIDWSESASPLAPLRLQVALKRLLGRNVDVTDEANLYWAVKPQVLSEAVPL